MLVLIKGANNCGVVLIIEIESQMISMYSSIIMTAWPVKRVSLRQEGVFWKALVCFKIETNEELLRQGRGYSTGLEG